MGTTSGEPLFVEEYNDIRKAGRGRVPSKPIGWRDIPAT